MIIEKRPIAAINPAPYNPRVALKPGDAAYERLRRSLDEFDLVQPLVWNRRTGHLVGGHQRLEVLKTRGDTEVEVVVVDLPPEREKALNIALNNPNVAGDWDLEKLATVIDELKAADFDATLTGFSDEDLRGLLFEPQQLAPGEHTRGPGEPPGAEPRVDVRLLVPPEHWDNVKADLDPLVDRHQLECHVRLPE